LLVPRVEVDRARRTRLLGLTAVSDEEAGALELVRDRLRRRSGPRVEQVDRRGGPLRGDQGIAMRDSAAGDIPCDRDPLAGGIPAPADAMRRLALPRAGILGDRALRRAELQHEPRRLARRGPGQLEPCGG